MAPLRCIRVFALLGASLGAASSSPAVPTNAVCWGSNAHGQSSVPPNIGPLVAIDSGWGGHTVARRGDGASFAWGRNDFGQSSIPPALGVALHIDAGHDHSIGLREDGAVFCWGRNQWGQCSIPSGLGFCSAVDAGYDHNLAIEVSGTVRAWGSNWAGQSSVPVSLTAAIQLAAGGGHNLVRRTDGSVFCWGYNVYGECNVPGGTLYAESISAGDYFSVALLNGGTVSAWGRNQHNQTNVPAGLSNVVHVDAGVGHVVAARSDGTVVAWGRNNYGESTVPPGMIGVIAVSASYDNSAALTSGCPTVIRVPEDAPSINAAAAMVCAGTTAEIVVAKGTWAASIVSAELAEITIRGAGVGVTTIVPSVLDSPIVLGTQHSNWTHIHLSQVTVANVGGWNWRVSFDHCRVESCSANFFPEGRHVSDTAFVSCNTGYLGLLYMHGASVVERCTFTGCLNPILYWQAHTTVRDCEFTDCHPACVWVREPRNILIERCSFNNTDGRGVLIEWQPLPQFPYSVEIIDSSFDGGFALGGNGAAILIDTPGAVGGSTAVTNCSFTNNIANSGGAIYTTKDRPLTLDGCTFTNNSAANGGAVAQEESVTALHYLSAIDCAFTGNSATQHGGAIYGRGWAGTVSLTNCDFTANTAAYAGAVQVSRQTLDFTGCTFDGNTSTASDFQAGGAIDASITDGLVSDCVFRSNHSNTEGGAISFYPWCITTVDGCLFEENDARRGGAIAVRGDCAQELRNCVFKGNHAVQGGAAVDFLSINWNCALTNSHFQYAVGDAPLTPVVEGDNSGIVALADNTFCGITSQAFSGVANAGGNCISESCTDTDGDGTPDECEIITVPGDYATIQAAIDATALNEFNIIAVAAGTYNESFALNGKNVVVRGAADHATIIDGAGLTTSIARFTGGEPATAGLENLVLRNGTAGALIYPEATFTVGGAVFATQSSAFVHNCWFQGNRARFGGAMYAINSTIDMTGCEFTNNIGITEGGGVLLFHCAGSVTNSHFDGNSSGTKSEGGGSAFKSVGALTSNGVFTLDGCTIENGVSSVGGAAIEHYEDSGSFVGVLRVHNSTVTNNSSGSSAGGIRNIGRMQACVLSGSTSVCSNLQSNIDGPYFLEDKATVCDCHGDVTNDGTVNGADLAVVLSSWGLTLPNGVGDVDHNGVVDAADLAQLLGSWGNCS